MDRDLGFRAGTIWSFERVSAAVQAQGRGLVRQGSRAVEWCERHGLELADERALSDPGRSAYHGKHLRRGGPLDVFMELAERELLGPDPVLLVEAIDRLSRLKARQALEAVFLRLINAGVTIVTLMDNAFYNQERCDADGTALVMLTLKCQAAHEYSLHLADRQRDNWSAVRQELRQGVVSRRNQFKPAWLDWDEARGCWQFNQQAAAVLRAMELLRHHGYSTAAKMLNEEGYKPARSERWTASNLSTLLVNSHQIYGAVAVRPAGTWKPLERGPAGELIKSNGQFIDPRAQQGLVRGGSREPREIVEGAYPALMSRSQVEEVVALIRSRNRGGSRPGPGTQMHWIGRGLTRCICGASMSTCVGGHPPDRLIRYVRCRERDSSENCRRPYLPMQTLLVVLLSRLTLKELSQLAGTADLSGEQAQQRKRVDDLLALQAQLDDQLLGLKSSLSVAAEQGGEHFALVMETLTTRLAQKQRELEECASSLSQARVELSRSESPLALEAVETVIEPLKARLVAGTSTQQERYQANVALKQIGLQIHVDADAMQMGLQVGGGVIDWQPIDEEAALLALAGGECGVRYIADGDVIVAAG